MDKPHIGGHQVLDPVPEDRVGMPAAELHQAVLAPRLHLGGEGPGEPPGQGLIPEIVDVLHAEPSRAAPASAMIARVRSASSGLILFRAYPTWTST
jgi:hypothetical protein